MRIDLLRPDVACRTLTSDQNFLAREQELTLAHVSQNARTRAVVNQSAGVQVERGKAETQRGYRSAPRGLNAVLIP